MTEAKATLVNLDPSTWELNVTQDKTAYNKTNQAVSPLWRLGYIYSVYQLVLVTLIVALPRAFPAWFVDYVRAATAIVAIGWIGIYIRVGKNKIFDMYASLFPYIPRSAFYLIDIGTHFVPLLVMGLPRNAMSYLIAVMFITLWYHMVRLSLPTVYNLLPITEMDLAFYALAPLLAATLYIIHKLT